MRVAALGAAREIIEIHWPFSGVIYTFGGVCRDAADRSDGPLVDLESEPG